MTLNLEPIKARLDAATKGPWKEHGLEIMTAWPVCWNLIHASTENGHPAVYEFKREEDSEFVANAPTDIAALIEGYEKQKLEKEKLSGECAALLEIQMQDFDEIEMYKSLINKIKAVCEQSNNSDGAYIKRLIEEMEGEGDVKSD